MKGPGLKTKSASEETRETRRSFKTGERKLEEDVTRVARS